MELAVEEGSMQPKTDEFEQYCQAVGAVVPADRRASPRFHTVCFDVTMERRAGTGLFRARNISDAGVMLHAHLPLDIGEQVTVSPTEQFAIAGTVVWQNQRCCGIQFERPIDCMELLRTGAEHKRVDRRCSVRLTATRLATTYSERGIRAVKVVDVSHKGMGLAHDGGLARDMLLRLILETGVEREARVRWSRHGQAGIRLLEPLSCDELARVTGPESRYAPVVPEAAMAG
jgi:hypothetical protein